MQKSRLLTPQCVFRLVFYEKGGNGETEREANGTLDGRDTIKTSCCIKCWNCTGMRASWAASINTTALEKKINGFLAEWSQRAGWSQSRGFQACVNNKNSICNWTYSLFSHLWHKWLHTPFSPVLGLRRSYFTSYCGPGLLSCTCPSQTSATVFNISF